MKRMKQRRGQEDGNGAAALAPMTAPSVRPVSPEISAPGRVVEFGREVRSELRQVAWPSRKEVANSAAVVIIVLVLLVGVIFLLNYGFSHGVLDLLTP
jgi:preprotein translocase subunit SecE